MNKTFTLRSSNKLPEGVKPLGFNKSAGETFKSSDEREYIKRGKTVWKIETPYRAR